MAFNGPYPTTFSGATSSMVISDTVFSGNVVNSRTIGLGGVSVISSTFQSGGLTDGGAIAGGIRIDSNSEINTSLTATAIAVKNTARFTGGITNSGTVVGGINAISIDTLSSGFFGGLSNTGVIEGMILVLQVPTFTGGISNGGKITGQIFIGFESAEFVAVSNFAGGITNSGTIAGTTAAAMLITASTFSGGISNSGRITGPEF